MNDDAAADKALVKWRNVEDGCFRIILNLKFFVNETFFNGV